MTTAKKPATLNGEPTMDQAAFETAKSEAAKFGRYHRRQGQRPESNMEDLIEGYCHPGKAKDFTLSQRYEIQSEYMAAYAAGDTAATALESIRKGTRDPHSRAIARAALSV